MKDSFSAVVSVPATGAVLSCPRRDGSRSSDNAASPPLIPVQTAKDANSALAAGAAQQVAVTWMPTKMGPRAAAPKTIATTAAAINRIAAYGMAQN